MSAGEREKVAMFRYGVIASLVCRRLENRHELTLLRREILAKEWIYPDGSSRKVADRTLREWVGRYKRYGLDGLYDGLKIDRKNKGRFRAITADVVKRAEQLRRELPERSVKTIVEILKAEGVEIHFSERSLQRQLKRLNATRCQIEKTDRLHQRWEQEQANDLWHGDTAHAVWLPDPSNPNKMKRTKLIVFVDDASRICTHGEFYFDERLPSLIDTFSKALLKRGKPRRLLLDNAFIFHSTTLEVMCAELETELSFCRPRRPQGKGKVERLIRTIKESFVSEANRAGFTSLEELNQSFFGWLEKNYHQQKHSEIKQTPDERWRVDVEKLQAITPEHIRRALMMRAKRRVQEQTGTIYLDGMEYSCTKEVSGLDVEVRWHVDVADHIEVWLDGKFVEIAKLSQRPTTLPHSIAIEQENYPTYESAKLRLEKLRQISGLQPLPLRADEFLTDSEFEKLLARYLTRDLSAVELRKLREFFKLHAPVRRMEAETALIKSVSVKGAALHLRYYLEAMESSLRKGGK
ncbi:MAG: DDE-type integrase/transposase/recombinase [Candidatus Obscuribacterales bacterium]